MQPKFYIGPAMHHTLDREYSRSRKYLQLTNERLVQAELALRYWQEHDNLYLWAPIPITRRELIVDALNLPSFKNGSLA